MIISAIYLLNFSMIFFFVSFIITGAMIVLNLFVGVIMAGMEEARMESELQNLAKQNLLSNISLQDEVLLLNRYIKELSKKLLTLNERLKVLHKNPPNGENPAIP